MLSEMFSGAPSVFARLVGLELPHPADQAVRPLLARRRRVLAAPDLAAGRTAVTRSPLVHSCVHIVRQCDSCRRPAAAARPRGMDQRQPPTKPAQYCDRAR